MTLPPRHKRRRYTATIKLVFSLPLRFFSKSPLAPLLQLTPGLSAVTPARGPGAGRAPSAPAAISLPCLLAGFQPDFHTARPLAIAALGVRRHHPTLLGSDVPQGNRLLRNRVHPQLGTSFDGGAGGVQSSGLNHHLHLISIAVKTKYRPRRG